MDLEPYNFTAMFWPPGFYHPRDSQHPGSKDLTTGRLRIHYSKGKTMANSLLIFTEEGVKRVLAGLAELPSKLSHELLNDIESQLSMIKEDIQKYVALVEEHFTPHKAEALLQETKAKVESEAKAVKAAADKVVSTVETAAKDMVADATVA